MEFNDIRAETTEFLFYELARTLIETAESAKNGWYTDNLNTHFNNVWIEYDRYIWDGQDHD